MNAKLSSSPLAAGAKRWPADWFWGVLLAACALTAWRVWLIGHSGISLFIDEAYYWGWSRELAWGYYSKPPLIAWLIRASNAVFGEGVLGTKALSMLLYPLTSGVIYLLGRDLFNAKVGLVAALAFISSFMVGLLGLFVSTDSLLLLFWALAAWCWWRALQASQMGGVSHWWLGAGLALGLGLLSKYTMAAFAATALWTLWSNHRLAQFWPTGSTTFSVANAAKPAWKTPGPWLAAALALCVFAPHMVWNLQNGNPTLRHTAEITTLAQQAGGMASAAEFWAGQLLLLGPVPLLVLLAVAAQAGLTFWRERFAREVQQQPVDKGAQPSLPPSHYLLALALPLLAVTTAQALRARANINWGAPVYVAASVLFAAWVCGVLAVRQSAPARAHPRWLAATVGLNVLALVLVCHAADIARLLGRPLPAKADVFLRMRGWHEAFAALRPLAQQRTGLPVLGIGRGLLAQASYEWRDLQVQPLAWNPQRRSDDQYQLTTELTRFRGQDMLLLLEEPLPSALAARFEAVTMLGEARVDTAPGKQVRVSLWLAQQFKGYAALP